MRIILYLILFLLLAVPTFAGDIAYKDTQKGMNETAMKRLISAETEMRKVFDQLILRSKGNEKAVEKLRKAQVAWEVYRDAQLDTLWPSSDKNDYGSEYPMCVVLTRAQLTETRTKDLRTILTRQDGDVCAAQWPE